MVNGELPVVNDRGIQTEGFLGALEIVLNHATGYTEADCILRTVIGLFEADFSHRILSYYVEGSYADQAAVATSDLDMTIVFRNRFVTPVERSAAQQTILNCQQNSKLELDITLVEETALRQQADPMLKLGARLVYGMEIRDDIPLIPIDAWARQRMHAAYWLMINVFARPKPVCSPLDFPQPAAEFFGYTNRTIKLSDGRVIPSTRNLIRVIGWIATARIAYEGREYVARKRDCVATYRQIIHDEWTALLEQIDQRCRTAWHYHLPASPAEQAELHHILQETLRFENHFLVLYRQFLLAELTSTNNCHQQDTLCLLDDTFYADPAVVEAVKNLQGATTDGGYTRLHAH